jgi:hypothetical protein
MTMSTRFEVLCVELILELFSYFAPHELVQSFSSLNGFISAILLQCPLRASIGGVREDVESYTRFATICLALTHRALGRGARLISLRISLTRAIGSWSLLAPIFHRQRALVLCRLHLIDMRRHEFDRLLRALTGAPMLHTLLVDLSYPAYSDWDARHTFLTMGEGCYLAEVYMWFCEQHHFDVCILKS